MGISLLEGRSAFPIQGNYLASRSQDGNYLSRMAGRVGIERHWIFLFFRSLYKISVCFGLLLLYRLSILRPLQFVSVLNSHASAVST